METLAPLAPALTLGTPSSPVAGISRLDDALGSPGTDALDEGTGIGQTVAVAAGGGVAPAFGDLLNHFLGQVDNAQHDADAMVESLALGEPVDVHQVMLALNQASDALQLTLQVRGKILDAYQEVMKTQI